MAPFGSLRQVLTAFLCATAVAATAPAQSTAAVPDLSGFWNHTVAALDWENPPEGGPGPVHNTLPIRGNSPVWVGDYSNPILQPWTAEAIKKFGEMDKLGQAPPTAQMTCKMSGVPAIHTILGSMQILQTPEVVFILHQRDHQVRRVYMNVPHSTNPRKSWYGESVGHYEGDTLVIDTIGLNDKTVTDRMGTPHTEDLHVVERYRPIDGGRGIEVRFTITDPKAFTTPWSAMIKYQRNARQTVIEEEVCAEYNYDVVTKPFFPIPTAEKADF
jgi:hypothetical protein